MSAPPQRKRIVPQQIFSPTKDAPTPQQQESAAAAFDQVDLKEQSDLAEKLLGPGRKIYIKLQDDPTENIVNWYKLLKERGIKTSSRSKVAPDDGTGPKLPSRPEPTNPLFKVIQKLERAVALHEPGSDDDMSTASEGDSSASEDGAASGDEDEGEGAEGGKDGDGGDGNRTEGGTTEGEGNNKAGGTANGGEPNGTGGAKNPDGTNAKPAGGKRSKRGDEYDYNDPFFDDTEFYNMLEKSDKRKPKHDGFNICKGAIERTEEYLPGFEAAEKAPRKRKTATEPGAEGQQVVKKKKTAAGDVANGLTTAQMAAMAGAGIPIPGGLPRASSAGAKKEKKPVDATPYVPPQDVLDAIADIKRVALSASPPPAAAANGPDGKPAPKRLPQPVVDELKTAEHIFLREHQLHKPAGSKYILDELMSFLGVYTKRENLRLYVCGRPTGNRAAKEKPVLGPEALQELVGRTVKPLPAADETDDDFRAGPTQGGATQEGGAVVRAAGQRWKDVPFGTRREIYRYVEQRLKGGDPASALGNTVLQQVLGWFPAGSLELIDLQTLITQERNKEAKAAFKAAAAAAAPPAQPAGGNNNAATILPELPPPGVYAMQPRPASAQQQQNNTPQKVQPPSAAAPPAVLAPEFQAAIANNPLMAQIAAALVQSPSALAAATAIAAQAKPSPPAAQPAVQQQQQNASVPSGASGKPSDADILALGTRFGASQSDLQTVLATPGGQYQTVLLRVLAALGPSGGSPSEIAAKAVELGLADWDPSSANVRKSLSRQTNCDHVVHLGKYKYALKYFPGVVAVPRKANAKNAAAGASVAASEATGNGGDEGSNMMDVEINGN